MFFEISNLNIINIKKGQIVEIMRESDEGTKGDVKIIRGVVVETSKRWFRVYVKSFLGGYYTCVHYVDTYMNGKKLRYRVIGSIKK